MWKVALVKINIPMPEEVVCFVREKIKNSNINFYEVVIPWRNVYINTSEDNIIKFL